MSGRKETNVQGAAAEAQKGHLQGAAAASAEGNLQGVAAQQKEEKQQSGSGQGAGYSTSKYEPGLHGAAAAAHDRKVEREQGQ